MESNLFARYLFDATEGGKCLGSEKLLEIWEECITWIFPDDVYVFRVEYEDGIRVYIYSYLNRDKITDEQRAELQGLADEVLNLTDFGEVNLIFNYAHDCERYSGAE